MYLQMVSENINKDIIRIVGITNQGKHMFNEIKTHLHNIPGISIDYSEISADKTLILGEKFLSEIDLILVQNLSLDEYVSYIINLSLVSVMKLYRNYKQDWFH